VRSFVAIDLGAAGEALERELPRLKRIAPKEKWVRSVLHLTVEFLGEVLELEPVSEVLEAVTAKVAPFTLSLEGGGSFGSRVLWAGVGGELEALRALHARVIEGLRSTGHVPEREGYSPHVTLARSRGGAGLERCLEAVRALSLGAFRVEELVLFTSELRAEGSVHTPRSRHKLRG
jgi:2'-5' RNA ligase